jgi:hypothetical protein
MRPAAVGAVTLLFFGFGAGLAVLSMVWPEVRSIVQRSSPVTAALLIAGTFFVVRHFRRSAQAVLATTNEPPIIVLRSFRDDSSRAGGTFTFEQLAGAVLRTFGPLVAIGKPGERLPPLGAARVYRTNDTWQGTALDLMATAKLIVMIAGTTSGLQWEFDRIFERDWQRKLLIVLLPLSGANLTARLRALSDGLAGSRWEGCLSGMPDDVAAVRFEPDGSAVIVRAHGYRRNPYHLRDAIRVALFDMWCRAEPENVA